MKTQDKLLVTIGTVAVIGVAGFVGYGLFTTKDTTSAVSQTTTATSAATTTSQSASTNSGTSTYADGTYTASTTYSVPKGDVNSISATVTVKDGVITDVTTTNDYTDHESGRYIDSFESGISGAVSGDSLASASAGRVGGASLTSSAFDDVLDLIRSDAQA